nr:putative zinc finger A20 and AN1 domain-containing stress-associated protein 8 [Tanacetum cinerariifolium]
MPSMKEELDQSTTPPLCKTGCEFYVNKETGGFCSGCYKADVLKNKASSEVPKILDVNNNVDNQEPVEIMIRVTKCGESFCGLHRMPEKHACKFDFKAAGRVAIEKHKPLCGRICLNFIFLIPRSGGIRRTKENLEKNVLTWSPKAKSCPCGQS